MDFRLDFLVVGFEMDVINLFELLYLPYGRLYSGLLHDCVVFVLFEGLDGLLDGIIRVN